MLDAAQPRTRTDADPDAEAHVDALGKAIEAARPDALVAIGPMTNVGALIGAGFDLPRLAIMGGKIQDVMLQGLMKRARRAGVADRIRPHLTTPDRIGLEDQVDFAIACWVIHETPDVDAAFRELASILRPGGRLFVLEPRSHASEEEFGRLLAAATAAGLSEVARPRSIGDRAVVLERPLA